jgi:3-oxoacyl-[acyl-carrier-protein] synthase II
MGIISPVGLDVPTAWENLIAGRSGIGPITLFDASDLEVRIAGEVHGFDPANYMTAREARHTDRFAHFAIAALAEVLAQSRLVVDEHNAYEVGAIMGAAIGGVWTFTGEFDVLREKGPRRLNPLLVTMITVDAGAVQVALRTGAQGPNLGVSSACSTGVDAIGQAYETIMRGDAKAMFTGSFESAVSVVSISTFDRMRVLSRRNDDPGGACRPYAADRDGFVAGEGGAMFLLEDLEYARARGAEPLAEVLGYAATSDAAHVAAPDAEGRGVAQCMTLAMRRAGVTPEQISYINPHGAGTLAGDPAETQAIKRAFGDHAYHVAIGATKPMTGHLMGGAGSLEAAICVQVLRTGIIPPTINLHTPDPACDLDYVPNQARHAEVEVAMSDSIGLGGHNATLVLRAWHE